MGLSGTAVGLVAALGLALAMLVGAGRAGAQEGVWQGSPVTAASWRLFAPASGALFARVEKGLQRSDDGGDTWREVALPEGPNYSALDPGRVVVHPLDQELLYAGGAGGLHRSADGGATWELILPTEERVAEIAPSAAEPGLVYAAVGTRPRGSIDWKLLRVLRSHDGGTTWEQLREVRPSHPMGSGFWLLAAHPGDPQRAFFAMLDETRGPIPRLPLELSIDQGTTWQAVYGADETHRPQRIVGGQGAGLERLYATVQVPASRTSGRGSQLLIRWRTLRSDDRGATWQQLDERQVESDNDTFALAADPNNPDRIFGLESPYAARVSTDGGRTWSVVAAVPTRTTIADLTLGTDGRHLYAATYNGVFRLPLQP